MVSEHYRDPSETPAELGHKTDEAIEQLVPTTATRIATALCLASAGFALMTGLQSSGMVRGTTESAQTLLLAFRISFLSLSFGLVLAGLGLGRNRLWGAALGVTLSPLLGLIGVGFILFALRNAIFACQMPLLATVPFGAAALSFAALGPTRRANAARRYLSTQGMDAGI